MLDLFPDTAAVAGDELLVGGISADRLAEEFGTPLVVYCEDTLRAQAKALKSAVGDGHVAFGSKAFANVAVLQLLRDEGIGVDVASLGELAFAREAGYRGDEIVVHGNNKELALLEAAGRPRRGRAGGRGARAASARAGHAWCRRGHP